MSLNNLSKSQIIVLAAVAVFVVIEVFLFATGYLNFDKDAMNGNNDKADNEDQVSTSTDVDIPEMTTEVNESATNTKANVEVDIQNEEGESTGSKLGVFQVSASSEGFNPSQLVVNQGDVLEIRFSSEEGIDFYIPAYGVHISSTGDNRQVSFSASASGTFRIECRDSCPSDEKIYGELIVKPKQ